MRIYIIGNDGITLCRKAPASVTDGEIAVASQEELHAAPLSGKRLLALWNALPDVEKRKKVGDRGALIDQLWSAIEALPAGCACHLIDGCALGSPQHCNHLVLLRGPLCVGFRFRVRQGLDGRP